MAAAGLGLDALTLRCIPADREAIGAAVWELMGKVGGSGGDGGRVGFICRSEPLAAGAALAATEHKLRVGREVGIVLSDAYRKPSDTPPQWPHLTMTMSPDQIGQQIGRMLVAQAANPSAEPEHLVIPVHLRESGA
jgi:DNA-binding LacI/PurR family transcriptional regulator